MQHLSFSFAGLAILICLTGCVGHRNSYGVNGHRTSLRFLTLTEVQNLPETLDGQVQDPAALERRVNEIFPVQKIEPVTTAAITTFVVGALTDYAQSELKKEAAKYEAQFANNVSVDNFWTPSSTNGSYPQYAGLEFLRWTKDHPKSTKTPPAMRLILAFRPNPQDPRFFDVHPVYFRTVQSKAKVSRANGLLTTEIRLGMYASWVDKDLTTRLNTPIGMVNWEISGYDLDKTPELFFLNEEYPEGHPYFAGTFAAPALSYLDEDQDGKADKIAIGQKRASPFKVTIQLTERDESKTADYIEKAATFLEEKKPEVQKIVVEQVEKQ